MAVLWTISAFGRWRIWLHDLTSFGMVIMVYYEISRLASDEYGKISGIFGGYRIPLQYIESRAKNLFSVFYLCVPMDSFLCSVIGGFTSGEKTNI